MSLLSDIKASQMKPMADVPLKTESQDSIKSSVKEVPSVKEVSSVKEVPQDSIKMSANDYQRRTRELALKNGKIVKDYIDSLDNVPQEVKEASDWLGRERKKGRTQGKPAIYKVFGNSPKVGDSLSALKIFENTGKGFTEMRLLVKRWNEQGIIVTYDEATKVYTIKGGDISAYDGDEIDG